MTRPLISQPAFVGALTHWTRSESETQCGLANAGDPNKLRLGDQEHQHISHWLCALEARLNILDLVRREFAAVDFGRAATKTCSLDTMVKSLVVLPVLSVRSRSSGPLPSSLQCDVIVDLLATRAAMLDLWISLEGPRVSRIQRVGSCAGGSEANNTGSKA